MWSATATTPSCCWPVPTRRVSTGRRLRRALVGAGFRVVRFDHRDCGRSSWFGSEAGYLLDDLAADLIGLLDLLAVDTAHLVGRSMGGMVAQVAALDHPERVRSLTLLGSTAGAGDERLPGPDDEFVDAMMHRLYAGPPPDRRALAGWLAELAELLAGDAYPFDADSARRLAAAELATGWQPESGHGVAVHAAQPARSAQRDSATDTVVHGTADPVFPIERTRAGHRDRWCGVSRGRPPRPRNACVDARRVRARPDRTPAQRRRWPIALTPAA